VKKKLSLKKLTVANLRHAELIQLQGGNTFTEMARSDCQYDRAWDDKMHQDGTIGGSCDTAFMFVCY